MGPWLTADYNRVIHVLVFSHPNKHYLFIAHVGLGDELIQVLLVEEVVLQVVLPQDLPPSLEFLRRGRSVSICTGGGGPSRLLPGSGTTPPTVSDASFPAATVSHFSASSSHARPLYVTTLVLKEPFQVSVLPGVAGVPEPADDVRPRKVALFCQLAVLLWCGPLGPHKGTFQNMELLWSLFTLIFYVFLAAAGGGQIPTATSRRRLTTSTRRGGGKWRRGSSSFSCFCSIVLHLPSVWRIWRGTDRWHFSSLSEPRVDLPPRQFGLCPQAAQFFIWWVAALLEALLKHHQLLRGLLFKLLQSKVWEWVPRFGSRLLLLHRRCAGRKGRSGVIVTRVNNNGGTATTAATSSTPSIVENNDVAVLGVALVVPGVTEPLLDLSLCQAGDLHEPRDFCIGDKVVSQVAGLQLRQLLFGLLRPHTECVSAEGRVLLREREREKFYVKQVLLVCWLQWEHNTKHIFVWKPALRLSSPVEKEREVGQWWLVSAHCSLRWAGRTLCWSSGTGWAVLLLSA